MDLVSLLDLIRLLLHELLCILLLGELLLLTLVVLNIDESLRRDTVPDELWIRKHVLQQRLIVHLFEAELHGLLLHLLLRLLLGLLLLDSSCPKGLLSLGWLRIALSLLLWLELLHLGCLLLGVASLDENLGGLLVWILLVGLLLLVLLLLLLGHLLLDCLVQLAHLCRLAILLLILLELVSLLSRHGSCCLVYLLLRLDICCIGSCIDFELRLGLRLLLYGLLLEYLLLGCDRDSLLLLGDTARCLLLGHDLLLLRGNRLLGLSLLVARVGLLLLLLDNLCLLRLLLRLLASQQLLLLSHLLLWRGNILHSCCLLLGKLRLLRHLLDLLLDLLLLLLFAFFHSALGVFLFTLLFFIVLRDAFFDIGLKIAAQEDWQLGQFESDLVIVVSLGIFLNDGDDALGLLRSQRIYLVDQVVTLLNSQRFLINVHSWLCGYFIVV